MSISLLAMMAAAAVAPAEPGTFSVDVGYEFFVANYEYFDIPFRQGETIIGDLVEGRVGYHESNELALYLGAVARKPYDGDGADRAYPLATLAYLPGGTGTSHWLFGSLPRHHDFVVPLYDPSLDYLRAHLDGLEYGSATLTSFINWDLYDTEEHGERFSANILGEQQLGFLTLTQQARWTHQGGQLHEHPDTGVTHDRVAMLGVEAEVLSFSGFKASVRPEGYANRYTSSVDASLDRHGWGQSGQLRLVTPGPELAVEGWRSKDFYTADGDPLYRAEKMSTATLSKQLSLARDRLRLGLAFKGYWLDGTFAHSQLITAAFHFEKSGIK